MSQKISVNSLPLCDVIFDIAREMNTDYREDCKEFSVLIPPDIGVGYIKGVNFSNGLGLIHYKCTFNNDFAFYFNANKIHPLKFLYCLYGTISHSFLKEEEYRMLSQYRCAIVSGRRGEGHILKFHKERKVDMVSLEIDRRNFGENFRCEIEDYNEELKNVLTDKEAHQQYFHEGYYDLQLAQLFKDIDISTGSKLVRQMRMESKALRMLVTLLNMFGRDRMNLNNALANIERKAIVTVNEEIEQNLINIKNIDYLTKQTGLNKNKLQDLFKRYYGTTLNRYITKHRMDVAADFIKYGHLSLSEVSELIGYSSKSYFSRKFKEYHNVLPSQFKRLILDN